MAHGVPLATGSGEQRCGVAGPFLVEVGISSSYHIAKFWGLTKPRKRGGILGRWRPQAAALAVARRGVLTAALAKWSRAKRWLGG
jgi:hypothetical protein